MMLAVDIALGIMLALFGLIVVGAMLTALGRALGTVGEMYRAISASRAGKEVADLVLLVSALVGTATLLWMVAQMMSLMGVAR